MTSVTPIRQEVPPSLHAVEAEQALLGEILLDPANIEHARTYGGADLFYDPAHRAIYSRISELDNAGAPCGLIALREWAMQQTLLKDLGGAAYLPRLAGASIPGAASHARLLAESRERRRLFEAVERARAEIVSAEHAPGAVAGRLEAALINADLSTGPKPVSMAEAATGAAQEVHAAYAGEDDARVKTGLSRLDHLIGGFRPGQMVLLGGRPAMGKSAVALTVALNAAREGKRVAICSLEMRPQDMAIRALSEASSLAGRAISHSDMARGEIRQHNGPEIARYAQDLSKLPIQFLSAQYRDTGAMIGGVKQCARIMGGLDLLVVDYMQIMRAENTRGRYDAITEISIAIKSLAMTMEIPVLALSQLSRQVEQREDKRPQLSDLRESGQLEQDADVVMFAYRDEYYLAREEPDGRDVEKHEQWQQAMRQVRNKLEIIVAKQRQGPTGSAYLNCALAFNRIWSE